MTLIISPCVSIKKAVRLVTMSVLRLSPRDVKSSGGGKTPGINCLTGLRRHLALRGGMAIVMPKNL